MSIVTHLIFVVVSGVCLFMAPSIFVGVCFGICVGQFFTIAINALIEKVMT